MHEIQEIMGRDRGRELLRYIRSARSALREMDPELEIRGLYPSDCQEQPYWTANVFTNQAYGNVWPMRDRIRPIANEASSRGIAIVFNFQPKEALAYV